MKRRRLFVAAAVLLPTLAMLALLAYGFTREPHYIESPIIGRPAPGFALTLFDGRAVHLEDFRGVSTQDEEPRARAFLEEFGLSFPNGRDLGGRIAIDYGVWGLPEAFIVDPTGRITYKHIGTLGSTLLAAKIEEARAGVVSATQGRGDYQSTR